VKIKAANTGIKQLNFINMRTYTYRNISILIYTFVHAFLAFGNISKHFIRINCSLGPVDMVPLRWTNSKVACFYPAYEPQSLDFDFHSKTSCCLNLV